jgi:hypothetical protein
MARFLLPLNTLKFVRTNLWPLIPIASWYKPVAAKRSAMLQRNLVSPTRLAVNFRQVIFLPRRIVACYSTSLSPRSARFKSDGEAQSLRHPVLRIQAPFKLVGSDLFRSRMLLLLEGGNLELVLQFDRRVVQKDIFF